MIAFKVIGFSMAMTQLFMKMLRSFLSSNSSIRETNKLTQIPVRSPHHRSVWANLYCDSIVSRSQVVQVANIPAALYVKWPAWSICCVVTMVAQTFVHTFIRSSGDAYLQDLTAFDVTFPSSFPWNPESCSRKHGANQNHHRICLLVGYEIDSINSLLR